MLRRLLSWALPAGVFLVMFFGVVPLLLNALGFGLGTDPPIEAGLPWAPPREDPVKPRDAKR